MLIIAPLLGHATWYAYADMIDRPLAMRTADVADVDLMQSGSRRKVRINPDEAREGYWRKVRDLTGGSR